MRFRRLTIPWIRHDVLGFCVGIFWFILWVVVIYELPAIIKIGDLAVLIAGCV